MEQAGKHAGVSLPRLTQASKAEMSEFHSSSYSPRLAPVRNNNVRRFRGTIHLALAGSGCPVDQLARLVRHETLLIVESLHDFRSP